MWMSFVALVLLRALSGSSFAQSSLAPRTVTVAPGATNVVVPIDLSTTDPVTLLSFELGFPSALCGVLANPEEITSADDVSTTFVGGSDSEPPGAASPR